MRKAVSRRSLALVGGATVLALVAAGCGGSSDDSSDTAGKGKGPVPEPTEPVTVTFSSWVGNTTRR